MKIVSKTLYVSREFEYNEKVSCFFNLLDFQVEIDFEEVFWG